MSERYLTDAEMCVTERVYDGDYWDNYRRIATAASDKGYAAACRDIVEWLEGFGTTPRAGMTGAWLAELWRSEKGVQG